MERRELDELFVWWFFEFLFGKQPLYLSLWDAEYLQVICFFTKFLFVFFDNYGVKGTFILIEKWLNIAAVYKIQKQDEMLK